MKHRSCSKLNTIKNPNIGELFINPVCDVGFKKIMSNKEILVDFLNTFLPRGTPKIVSAELLPEERLGRKLNSKKVFFDVRAKDNLGRTYIIEVQKKSQDFFVKRSIYYNSREISSQGESGELNDYNYSPVYSISVLNFVPKEKWSKNYYNVFTYRREGTYEELTDATAQIIIVLPQMKLSSDELRSRRTKWCYLLRNAVKINQEKLSKLKWTDEDIFEKMKNILYVAGLTNKERAMLDEAKKIEMDYKAIRYEDTRKAEERGIRKGRKQGREEGREEGLLEGLVATAKKMLAQGFSIKTVTQLVDLPQSQIRALKASMNK